MNILGLMSGTSLDGVDLALCSIGEGDDHILAATTVPYSTEWRERLSSVDHGSALDLALTHTELGHFYGQLVRNFLTDLPHPCQAVASHGHTIFHQPQRGLTTQIGCPHALSAECGLVVVSDFRTLDMALGGQGAPLVPIGDELLFGHYDACLNLGGIANISYRSGEQRIAFDICPCNQPLNRLASQIGLPYDEGGNQARFGSVSSRLLESLRRLAYYRQPAPKSLGKEWVEECFWPAVQMAGLPVRDALRTVTLHIAEQVAEVLNANHVASVLVTGGGAHNAFLVETIASLSEGTQVIVPDALTVDYKEAFIFALLGYRRLIGEVNTLSSITGARTDSCGGSVSGSFG